VGGVPLYLIETDLTRTDGRERASREHRARTAADELTAEGTPVRFAGALYVPDDEVCFMTFDAATAGIAELAAQRAGLDPLRVVRAVGSDPDFPYRQSEAW
jgi:hypothetical protein